MRDEVSLLIGKQRFDDFLAYRIEADIYTADDAFSLS